MLVDAEDGGNGGLIIRDANNFKINYKINRDFVRTRSLAVSLVKLLFIKQNISKISMIQAHVLKLIDCRT